MSGHDVVDTNRFDVSKYSVLIVDDDQNVLNALQRLARSEPYNLICADSGADGLIFLAKVPDIAVIVSDQLMPEMSGTEFLIRSRVFAPKAVRMLLTGYSDMDVTVAAMNEGGATRDISKPWQESDLLQVMSTVF